ncbi:MAG: thioredoxin family protein [Desulfonatronovibrionaceae bacterium]
MDIKVLGPGCPKCKKAEELVVSVLQEEDIPAHVEKVTDAMDIANYGVFGTPAIVVDGQVISVGKVPGKEEIKAWVRGE